MAALIPTNVNIRLAPTMKDASDLASQAAGSVFGAVLPVVMFKQGSRYFLSGALPMAIVKARLARHSAPKKGSVSDAVAALNRPMDTVHVKTIVNYVSDNAGGKYILPPLTLSVQQKIELFTDESVSATKLAYVVLPMSAQMAVTDGQHRKMAIEELPDEVLNRDAIAVMIVCEEDMSQIHQDFADCSKTKPLPASQLAVYDRRNPANGLVIDLSEQCALFKHKIDATSTSLGKRSIKLFLANQVRQYVKELLIGAYAEPDDSFEVKAKQLLLASGDAKYKAKFELFRTYTDLVTAAIPVLTEVARLDMETQHGRIAQLRQEGYVSLTATGLVVLGRIGYEMWRDKTPDWQSYVGKLGEIDWRRSAPIWSGAIIQPGTGKVMTQQTPVKEAVRRVRQALGLPVGEPMLLESAAAAEAPIASAAE